MSQCFAPSKCLMDANNDSGVVNVAVAMQKWSPNEAEMMLKIYLHAMLGLGSSKDARHAAEL